LKSVNLSVEIEGTGENPALLLVHGFMSSNLQWAPNREALRKHFLLVAAELWGHGASPTPRDPVRYGVDAYLSEFESLRVGLGIADWFVCGQSFGAGIAMRYALAHPRVVGGLIVTNSRSALNDVGAEARAAGELAEWEAMDPRALPFHPCHAKRFPEDLKARMEASADRIDAYALWQAVRTTAQELSCRALASQIAVPTLLVNGRWEKSFQGDRDFAVATIPDLEVVDLDAGHSVNIEVARAFEEAVVDFATRIAARRP
jgi:pimeloyl-ACP methyl ester carboxylesterase